MRSKGAGILCGLHVRLCNDGAAHTRPETSAACRTKGWLCDISQNEVIPCETVDCACEHIDEAKLDPLSPMGCLDHACCLTDTDR